MEQKKNLEAYPFKCSHLIHDKVDYVVHGEMGIYLIMKLVRWNIGTKMSFQRTPDLRIER